MKRNYSLKVNLFDIFVGITALVMIIATLVVTNVIYASKDDQERIAEVYLNGILLEDKCVSFSSLKEDETIIITLTKEEYPDSFLLGDAEIHVNKEKGICVYSVTCPNHTCQNQGWVNRIGFPVVCLPNGFFAVIKADYTDIDVPLG